MTVDLVALSTLRGRVIGCAVEVHRALGPGLLESIYRECLMIELQHAGFRVERERSVCLHYRNALVGTPLRLDLLVDDRLVVEIKAVERLHPIHSAQVITYLKLSGLPSALLINFNTAKLVSGVKRLVHPALFDQPPEDESDS